MISKPVERRLSQIIAFGGFFTAIFLVSEGVTDPVNVTKFLSIGVLSGAVLGVILYLKLNRSLQITPPLLLVTSSFLLFSTISIFHSASPI